MNTTLLSYVNRPNIYNPYQNLRVRLSWAFRCLDVRHGMYGYGAEMEIDAASGRWCGFHSPCPVRSHLDDLNVARYDNGMATPPFQSVKLSTGNGCTYIYAWVPMISALQNQK